MGKNTIVKDTITLLAITLIAGLLLGAVYGVTKDPIDKANEAAKQAAYSAVYPGGSFAADDALNAALAEYAAEDAFGNKPMVTEVLSANGGEGYVMSCQANGYGGAVKLAVGIKDGKIIGVNVLDASNETPGLGAKCTDAAFPERFIDAEQVELDAIKISGATITSKACTAALNAALAFAQAQ